jgi:23S rRNA pseudouridine1911/1915/1917 synthase
MLLAKTQEGFECLKKQFQERTIQKTYHAFVYGNIKEDERVVDTPIGRSAGNIRKWTSGKDMRQNDAVRDAETHVRVLYRGVDEDSGEPFTFVEAKPKTGRTHQIRVHLNYIGRPLVGDKLYTKRVPILGFNRVALHAQSISFVDVDGNLQTIESPYPEDFENVIKTFEK